MPDAVIDGGELDCGSGLLLMIRNAIDPIIEGGILEIRSRESSVREDLPAWCRMVGHDLVEQQPGSNDRARPDGYTCYFVRKKMASLPGDNQEQDLDLGGDLETAKNYEWKLRFKWKEGMQGTALSRNHSFAVGRPLSFNTEDHFLCALEYLLGAIAGCLCMGFVWRLRKFGAEVKNLELALHSQLENPLVFLGIEEEGSPGLAQIRGKVYLALAPTTINIRDELLDQTWQETQRCSPVLQSLASHIRIDISLKRIDFHG